MREASSFESGKGGSETVGVVVLTLLLGGCVQFVLMATMGIEECVDGEAVVAVGDATLPPVTLLLTHVTPHVLQRTSRQLTT